MVMKTVEVTFHVEVEMDESRFTPEFMADFNETIFPCDSLDEHACHLAQMAVRGVLSDKFTEGYGRLADMGIKTTVMMLLEPRVLEP